MAYNLIVAPGVTYGLGGTDKPQGPLGEIHQGMREGHEIHLECSGPPNDVRIEVACPEPQRSQHNLWFVMVIEQLREAVGYAWQSGGSRNSKNADQQESGEALAYGSGPWHGSRIWHDLQCVVIEGPSHRVLMIVP